MNISQDKYLKTVFKVAKSYMAVCFNEHGEFLNMIFHKVVKRRV